MTCPSCQLRRLAGFNDADGDADIHLDRMVAVEQEDLKELCCCLSDTFTESAHH